MQGKISIRLLLLSILFMFTCGFVSAQDLLIVNGTVKIKDIGHKMEGVLVQVDRDGKSFDSYTTGGNSRFEFELDLGYNYKITFSKNGFVSKNIEISAKNIPEEDQYGGFKVPIEMTLFEKQDGFDESILDQPIGIMSFNANKNDIDWDFGYTEQIQRKVEAEFIRLENAANADELKKKQFDELMIKGSDNMTKEKYDRAIKNYEDALQIFPDDSEAQDKLVEAQRLFDEQNADEENQKKFDRAMQLGSSAMDSEDFELARSKFNEAQTLMPDKKEPKDKLRELDELENAAGNQAKFDELIADGDANMSDEEFQSALDNYKAARELFPSDKGVKKKINEAQDKLDEWLAAQDAETALEAKYQGFIDKGNEKFEDESYERAIEHFESALELKPGESYPMKKIDDAKKRIEDLAKEKADADALAEGNKVEEEYNGLIDEADDLYLKEKLEDSRLKYSEALTLKPNEKYPRQRINRIDELLEEKTLAAEKDQQKSDEDDARAKELELEKQKQEALEEERRRALKEKQDELDRIAQEEAQRKEDAEARRRTLSSNIDPNKERQAEEFYANERESNELETRTNIEKIKRDHYASLADKAEESKFQGRESASDVEQAKENNANLKAKGDNFQQDKAQSFERKEEEIIASKKALELEADERRKDNQYEVNELKKNQKDLTNNTIEFEDNVRAAQVRKEEVQTAQAGYQQKGDILRKDNEYQINDLKEETIQNKKEGEEMIAESAQNVEDAKTKVQKFNKENSELQDDRIASSYEKSERLKENQKSDIKDKEEDRQGNIDEVNFQKESNTNMLDNKSNQSEIVRNIAREEAFNVSTGAPKDFDDYAVVPGTEKLAEGVTEKSYEINNGKKLVIERTLKIGNKVVTYNKVIDQHGIYYFKDGRSITKTTWERETLHFAD